MPMVDMKYSKAEAKEESNEMAGPDAMPDYPYGLSISLDDAGLKKLGITDLPKVGDEYHITAVGKVTRLSSSSDENETENRMTIQITMMDMVHEDEDSNENESAASENAENKSGVKSLLTNSMR